MFLQRLQLHLNAQKVTSEARLKQTADVLVAVVTFSKLTKYSRVDVSQHKLIQVNTDFKIHPQCSEPVDITYFVLKSK